jgi:hypothetical protein
VKRSTLDVVVLLLTGTMCAVIVITAAGLVVLELAADDPDTTAAAQGVGHWVSVILGAVLGLVIGRRSNGHRD